MTAIKAEISGRLDEVTRIASSTEFNGKNLLDGSLTNGINLQVGISADENSKINLDSTLFAKADAETLLGDAKITADGKNIELATVAATNYARIGGDYFEVDGTHLTSVEATDAIKGGTYTAATKGNEYSFENADGSVKAVDNLDNIFKNDATAQSFLNNVDDALADVTARKTSIGATQQRVSSAMEVSEVMTTNLTSASSLIKDADIAKESSNYIKNQILQQTASTLLATANQNPSIALSLV